MFLTIDVNDLDIFEKTIFLLKEFIFRGQCNSEWKLEPKIDRVLSSFNKPRLEKKSIEYSMLEKCQKNAQLYLDNIPDIKDYYSWFSLIQHYGGPTRFIDFSYSPYIAAYFALSGCENNESIAIWCINKTKIWQKESEYFNLAFPDNWFGNFRYKTTEIFNDSIFDKNKKNMYSILLLDQKINHQRIAIQQGAFLASLDDMDDFDYCLNMFLGISHKETENISSINIDDIKSSTIIKFTINKIYYRKLSNKLKMMNITSESLFPGFEGFIKSFYMDIMSEK